MIQISAVWKKANADGVDYFTGNLGQARLLILPNKYKEAGDNKPDYIVCVAEPLKKTT